VLEAQEGSSVDLYICKAVAVLLKLVYHLLCFKDDDCALEVSFRE